MNGRSIIIILTHLVLLLILTVPSQACDCWYPPPGPCYKCQNGKWVACGTICPKCYTCASAGSSCICVWNCGSQQICCSASGCCSKPCCDSSNNCCGNTCCNGTCCGPGQDCCGQRCCNSADCCNNGLYCCGATPGWECCDDLICYNPSTSSCCHDGMGTICPLGRACCNGICLEPGLVCCGGSPCLIGHCCDNITCYDPLTKKCCNDGLGTYCDFDRACCYGTCCPIGQECCDGLTCYNPLTQKCCNDGMGTIKEKCQIIDGDSCSGLTLEFCSGCALNNKDCSWHSNTIVYEGGKEKICNPKGCDGDCNDDSQKLCYKEYPCRPFGYIPLHVCTVLETDPPGLDLPHCELGGLPSNKCYICTEGTPLEHYVQNESCN